MSPCPNFATSAVSKSISNFRFTIPSSVINETPEVIVEQTFQNDSSQPMNYVFTVKKDITQSSTFEHSETFEVKIGVSMTVTASVPLVGKAEAKTSIEMSTSSTYKYGVTNSTTETYQLNTPVVVSPNSNILMKAVLTKAKLDVPYFADLMGTDGNVYPIEGVYHGVNTYNLHVIQQNA